MAYFGKFYLDKEKDIVVCLELIDEVLYYEIHTPNHGTGNLISNLAKVINMPISLDGNGLKIIRGCIPSYINGENEMIYIMRLNNTKVANIFPNGLIERKAYIPAIAKTLMSQTKDYALDINKTLVKTFIPTDVKFHADLHTHRSANLSPDILIALGIHHQISYPYYYVKKLNLRLTKEQEKRVEEQRAVVAKAFAESGLVGKYLDRKIDDNTEINFADLIMNNIENSSINIPKIRNSLAVMKDGQAVFTNLEKVYLYRYVFTKGKKAKDKIKYENITEIEDQEIVTTLLQMEEDRKTKEYANNTLYQDKLLWTARSYQRVGVNYAEISDTALVKKSEAAATLREIHEIMPYVTKETGVVLRFLAAFRRIPLTIVKDQVDTSNYFMENLQVLKAVANDPYVAGSDFVGEEINDIRELKSVIAKVVEIAADVPGYVVRIHAGENDSLPDNVMNSVLCVEEALAKGQSFPNMRIGHGLYTAKLNTPKGKLLLKKMKERRVVLEFQITSNVRLNNLSEMKNHPLKQYLKHDVFCVQGTDGGALYGTDSMDEQLTLERMLDLNHEELKKMRGIEKEIIRQSLEAFEKKKEILFMNLMEQEIEAYYKGKIQEETENYRDVDFGERKYASAKELPNQIKELPKDKVPIIVAGGSFNNASHITKVGKLEKAFLDDLLAKADPSKVFFVIGPAIKGYEKYLLDQACDRFEVYAYIPASITGTERKKLKRCKANLRVSIESSPMGVYKSIAFEIFKRRENIILALDGNSSAANLIQDAKNSKYKSQRFINSKSKGLRAKADSLHGYITMWNGENADEVIRISQQFYEKLTQI